jgi:uncharacterized phosphosugar-binding protein
MADTPADLSPAGYLSRVAERLAEIGRTQLPAIERAAALVAAAIGGGHRVWVAKTSHCLLDELTFRAGGLIAVHQLQDPIAVEPGDAVVAGTPAGTAAHAIEVAVVTKARGASLVVLTQMAYETHPEVVRLHPSGRRLHEFADVLIDLGGPFGDGEALLPGSDIRVFPSSGVTVMAATWMILAGATAQLVAEGKLPLVYQSILVPGAAERNAQAEERYQRTRRGYDRLPTS